MAYPYTGQLAPAVGNGLGGLPQRKSRALSMIPVKRTVVDWTGSTVYGVLSALKNRQKTSVRVLVPHSNDSSSVVIPSGGEVFGFLGNNDGYWQLAQGRAIQGTGVDIYTYYDWGSDYINFSGAASTPALKIILTEYDFNYDLLATGTITNSTQADVPLAKAIKNLDNVRVTMWAETIGTGDSQGVVHGTFTPTMYLPTTTHLDIQLERKGLGGNCYYMQGGWFKDANTFVKKGSGFISNARFAIFELKD